MYENGGATCVMLAWNIDDAGWAIVPDEAFTRNQVASPTTTTEAVTTTTEPATTTTEAATTTNQHYDHDHHGLCRPGNHHIYNCLCRASDHHDHYD